METSPDASKATRQLVTFLTAGVTLAIATFVSASTSTQVKQLAPLVVPRTAHAATALSDGRVFITGGRDSAGNIVAVSEIFDPATETSTAGATLTTPRVDHTATLLSNGKVLVAGGSDGNGSLNSAEIFDPATGGFHVVSATMGAPRARHTATLLNNGTVLIAGGDDAGTAEIFDPTTESFSSALLAMAAPRIGHTATLFSDDSVLLAGGNTDSMERFTPTDQKFTLDPKAMSAARTGHEAIELSNTLLLFFGGDTGNTIDEFNSSVDTLALKGNMTAAASSATLLANGKILVLGANMAGLYAPDAADPSAAFTAFDETSVPGSSVLPRTGQTATELSGDKRILVAGGVNALNLSVNPVLFNAARIWTDKDDYVPGDNVILSGSGWKPNENVDLFAVDSQTEAWTYGSTVAADANGGFLVDPYFVVQLVQLGANFSVSAVGEQSAMQADVKFTDAGSFSYATTVGKSNAVSLTAGTSNSTTLSTNVTAPNNNTASFVVALTFANTGSPAITIGTGAGQINLTSISNSMTTHANPGGFTDTKTFPVTASAGSGVTPGTYHFNASANVTSVTSGSIGSGISAGGGWAFDVTVTAIPTTTAVALTSGSNPSTYGDPLTFRATVTSGSGTPTGSVIFYDGACGGTALTGTLPLDGSGQASFTTSALTAVSHTIRACYTPTGGFGSSNGSATQTVNKATPTPTLSVTNSPKNYNGSPQAATIGITSSVAGSVANVKYNGSSTVPTNAGSYAVTADFVPTDTTDYNSVPGLSAGSFVINPVTPSFSAPNATPNPIDCGTASVTVSGQLNAGTGMNQVAPSGQPVTITVAGALSVTATVSNNTAGTFSALVNTSGLTAGPHTITYHYGGDGANFNAAADNTSTSLTVNNCIADTTLTVDPASGTYGGTVSLRATLTKTSDSTAVSGKTINFTLNGNPAGSGVTNGSGVATSTTSVTLCGSAYNYVLGGYPTGAAASFTGDSSYAASSGTNSLTVNKANATVTVTPYHETYNCSPHTATYTVTGVCSESEATVGTVDVTNTAHTDAGTYSSDSWSFTGTANYNNIPAGPATTITDIIDKAPSTTTVTAAGATYTCSPYVGASASVTSGTGSCVLNQSLPVKYIGRSPTVYGPSNAAPTDAGDYTAQARYPGDANHLTSNDSKDFSIAKANANITVNPYHVPYDCNAHTATGTATGVAPCNEDLSSLLHLPASHTNAGDYPSDGWTFDGNNNYNATSDTVHNQIDKADTTSSVISDVNPSTIGQPVTFTATVAGNPAVTCFPTGSVTFKDGGDIHGVGGTVLGTGMLNGSAQATFSTSSLSAGDHSITAVYSGDGNFNATGATTGSTATLYTQSVHYTFIGFFQPVDNLPVWNSVKAGSVIPIKWQLKDYALNIICDLSTLKPQPLGLTSIQVTCPSGPVVVDPIEEVLAYPGSTVFRCDGTQFIYNWQTSKSWAGTCRVMTVRLADGTTHSAQFTFK